ncbi:hypothetical protein J6590_018065 [Homalodisca vitripennis]|nr:hypothetical protein J6590_018065 [Homalodisca vitripennis]
MEFVSGSPCRSARQLDSLFNPPFLMLCDRTNHPTASDVKRPRNHQKSIDHRECGVISSFFLGLKRASLVSVHNGECALINETLAPECGSNPSVFRSSPRDKLLVQ